MRQIVKVQPVPTGRPQFLEETSDATSFMVAFKRLSTGNTGGGAHIPTLMDQDAATVGNLRKLALSDKQLREVHDLALRGAKYFSTNYKGGSGDYSGEYYRIAANALQVLSKRVIRATGRLSE